MQENPVQSDGEMRVCPKTGKVIGGARVISPKASNSGKWASFKSKVLPWSVPIAGLFALIWFILRVLPKPARAAYPCQRVAAPMAASFVLWLIGLGTTVMAFKRARERFLQARYAIASLCLIIATVAGAYSFFGAPERIAKAEVFVPSDGANQPVGVGQGIFPGRVVWEHNTDATSWAGPGGTNYWYKPANTSQVEVDKMISHSLRTLTGASTDALAWDALFKSFNDRKGLGQQGYAAGEKIAIKLNMNNGGTHGDSGNSATNSPQMVLGLTRQLVNVAGVPAANITYYDAIRLIPAHIYDSVKAEFPAVHMVDRTGGDGREAAVRSTHRIWWSDPLGLETSSGKPIHNPTFVPTCASEATYMINLGLLRGHSLAGITLTAKNHFGSLCVDGNDVNGNPNGPTEAGPKGAGIHPYTAVHDFSWGTDWSFVKRPMATYNPLVDLMGHKDLGGKTMLYMIDGLYSTVDQSTDLTNSPLKFVNAPFNNDWPSSLLVSQDEVALESVGLDILRIEPSQTMVYGNVDNFLHEAAGAVNPPSLANYDPNNDGAGLESLGTHEHWNNAVDKKYSRNLGMNEGIELVISSNQMLPEKPTLMTALSVSLNSINFRWNDNSTNETGFKVYADPGAAMPTTLRHTTTADATSWLYGSLAANQQCSIQVAATNAIGDSEKTANFTTYTLIEAASGLAFSNVGLNSISVASTNTPSNLMTGSSGLYMTNTTNVTNSGWQRNNTPWASNGLSPNTLYAFSAKSRNGAARETTPATGSKYTLIEPVSGLTFSGVAVNSISVAPSNLPSFLTTGSSGIYMTNSTKGTNSGWRQNVTAWASTGLAPNTQYTFSGKSRNGAGIETTAATGSKWTLAATPVAPVVGNPSASSLDVAIGGGTANPSSTEYAIRISPAIGGNSWVQANGSLGTAEVWRTAALWGTKPVTGLAEGTQYMFSAKARNGENIQTATGASTSGQTQYLPRHLTYLAEANGSISGTTHQTVAYNTDGSEVVAVPDAYYHFVKWSDDVMTASRTDTMVKTDLTVTATFAINRYTVNFQTDGTPKATLTGVLSQTMDARNNCTEVMAHAPSGYLFAKWTKNGADYSMNNPLTVTDVTENMNLIATFVASKPAAVKDWLFNN